MEKKFTVLPPMVPNYVRVKETGVMMPVSDLSEKELRGLGAEWTEALVKHAQKKIV